MTFSTTWTDQEVLAELGRRIARLRLERNLTQEALTEESGVSRATLRRIEAGHSAQLQNLVRILRVLDLLPRLDALVPLPRVRPLEELERRGRERKRASSSRRSKPEDGKPSGPWTWGEDR